MYFSKDTKSLVISVFVACMCGKQASPLLSACKPGNNEVRDIPSAAFSS